MNPVPTVKQKGRDTIDGWNSAPVETAPIIKKRCCTSLLHCLSLRANEVAPGTSWKVSQTSYTKFLFCTASPPRNPGNLFLPQRKTSKNLINVKSRVRNGEEWCHGCPQFFSAAWAQTSAFGEEKVKAGAILDDFLSQGCSHHWKQLTISIKEAPIFRQIYYRPAFKTLSV